MMLSTPAGLLTALGKTNAIDDLFSHGPHDPDCQLGFARVTYPDGTVASIEVACEYHGEVLLTLIDEEATS